MDFTINRLDCTYMLQVHVSDFDFVISVCKNFKKRTTQRNGICTCIGYIVDRLIVE